MGFKIWNMRGNKRSINEWYIKCIDAMGVGYNMPSNSKYKSGLKCNSFKSLGTLALNLKLWGPKWNFDEIRGLVVQFSLSYCSC